jgi:hypothetical protein
VTLSGFANALREDKGTRNKDKLMENGVQQKVRKLWTEKKLDFSHHKS